MARVIRSRTRPLTLSGSYSTYLYGKWASDVPITVTKSSVIADSHGSPVVPSGLTSNQLYGPGLSLTGSTKTSNDVWKYTFDKWPVQTWASASDATPTPAPNGWMLDLVAGTNPSRPVFTPPTMAQDLIDLPKQVKQLGQLIRKPKSLMNAKELANHYLCAQFGWAPLIEDLQKLMQIQERTMKRCKELNDLYNSPTGIKRRLQFSSNNESRTGSYRFSLPGVDRYFDVPYDIIVRKKSWATINWKPTSPPPYSSGDDSQAAFARRLIFGLTVEGMAKGAWDVIPWTWLLGWFTNIGKYTLANSNTVPAQHGAGCFMSEVEYYVIPKGPSSPHGLKEHDVQVAGAFGNVIKTRTVSNGVAAGFNLPFMDGFKASILGALFAQRTMR